MSKNKEEVVLEILESQNQTKVCEECVKLIYSSELCSCKTVFRDQPLWYQNILNETKDKSKTSNGLIG